MAAPDTERIAPAIAGSDPFDDPLGRRDRQRHITRIATTQVASRAVYIIALRPAGPSSIRALSSVLKTALRRGLVCVGLRVEIEGRR
jgi:hypothetical protein